MAKEIVFVH